MNVFGEEEMSKEIPGVFDCRGNLIFSKDHNMDLNLHKSHT
jgi:hypothetical protein